MPPDRHRWFGDRSPKLPNNVVERMDPATLRQHLVAQVQSRLYQQFYQHGIAVPTVPEPQATGVSEAIDFVASLSAKNHGTGSWQAGWKLVERSEFDTWATRDGITVRVPPERLRDDSGTVAVLMPSEFRRQSPGFYLAQGDASLDPRPDDVLVRLYWHVTAAGAARLIDSATRRLNAAQIPFHIKVLDNPGAYRRSDAGVLYITKRDLERAAPLLDEIYRDVCQELRPSVPTLTKPLAIGLSLAEDPRNGESFGLHRCRLIAEAFVEAAEQGIGEPSRLIQAVKDRFQADGLDLTRPYLCAGSNDDYDQFHVRELPSQRHVVLAGCADPPTLCGPTEKTVSYVDVARAIGDQLVQDAIWYEDRCTWLGPRQPSTDTPSDRPASYGVVGPDLYSGTAGIALFLAQLFAETGDRTYRTAARGAVRQSMRGAEQLAKQDRAGLYTGWPGVAVALAMTGRLIDDAELTEDLPQHLMAHAVRSARPAEFDLLSGSAGHALAFLTLWRLLGDERYLNEAVQLGDHLCASARRRGDVACWPVRMPSGQRALTGFAHGASGIAFALLELFAATGASRFRQTAEAALGFERRNFHPALQNWLDLRYPVEGSRFGSGAMAASVWCHGSGGIAISRLRASMLLGEAIYRGEAELALHAINAWLDEAQVSSGTNWCLCHGLAGNADILLWASRSANEFSPLIHRAQAVAADGLQRARTVNAPAERFATNEPGLMLGLAGIGYFYLRLANPAIPSLLVPAPSDLSTLPTS